MNAGKHRFLFLAGFAVFGLLLLAYVLGGSERTKSPTRDAGKAASQNAQSPSLAAAQATPRQPSRQALRQWLQKSDDYIAVRGADYQIDSPRKRDENGSPLPFREQIWPAEQSSALRNAQVGDTVELSFFDDVRFRARVTGRWADGNGTRVAAQLEGRGERDRFFMSWTDGPGSRGLVELPTTNLAYEITPGEQGGFVVREWLFSDVVCATPSSIGADAGIPKAAADSTSPPSTSISPGAIPLKQSRPGAPGVIYLDFDGEIVSGTAWANGATINAPAARMTASQITETWERVSRDFAPYNVNVTTLRSVYDAAPANRRTHCVITSNDTAAPEAGGVAYLDSFARSDATQKICWSFIDDNPRNCAVVISHEVGHTLNLRHDGRLAAGTEPREEYYLGHGSGATGWAPVMGAGYYQQVVQWSRGEYARANNPEDDLAIITASSRVPYVTDDHGSTTGTATPIQSGVAVSGMIERNTDNDVFFVELDTGAQPVNITLPVGTMLDTEIRIYNASGQLLQTVNPPTTLAASTTLQLTVWEDAYVEVRGTGKPPVTGDGYSNYSSLGSYSLTAGSGTGTGPAIALSPASLPGFRANQGAVSPSYPLVVRARRLTGPLTVSATAPFQVSLDNATFAGSVQPTAGGTVHVRLGSGAAPGVLRRSLQASSSGATARSADLVGLVFGAPGGSMGFVQEALEKLGYFDGNEPPSAKFQNDYTLQFADYWDHLESRLRLGMTDREARADTIIRMMGYRPTSGLFEHTSGYLPVAVAFGSMARLGMSPEQFPLRNFARAARTGDERPVPVSVSPSGFNGLSGAPWGASRGMAASFRDVFASRAFRDRYGDMRLLSSAAFGNWLADKMFPGRSLGADGSGVLLDLLDNGFAADYSTVSERSAMARGAAAAFRSVYASVLLTQGPMTSTTGNTLEAPFQRKLHLAALRYQLQGVWDFGSSAAELSATRVADLLSPPQISAPSVLSLPPGGSDVSFAVSLADPAAPINSDVHYSVSRSDGSLLPTGVTVNGEGQVSLAATALGPGSHRIAVHAENLGGKTTRFVEVNIPAQGMGAAWMASHGLSGTVQTGVHQDGDGFSLAAEYAFGLDPNAADNAAWRVSFDGRSMVIEWTALKTGASYQVEAAADLGSGQWLPVAAAPVVLQDVGAEHQLLRVSVPPSPGSDQQFFRVKALFD